jgi:uncharacterized protein YkwD
MRQIAERSSIALVAVLTLAFLGAGCGGSGEDSSPTAAGGGLNAADVEFESLHLANQARSSEKIEPQLGQDLAVAQVARLHSEAMRDEGFFGHTSKNGDGLRQRLDKAGVQYSGAAENLAEVFHRTNPAGLAHNQLMASASHRKNILSPKYRLAGVGVAKAGDTYWITQIFIKP